MIARRRAIGASTWLAWRLDAVELLVEADAEADADAHAERASSGQSVAPLEDVVADAASHRSQDDIVASLLEALLASSPLRDVPRFVIAGEQRVVSRGVLVVDAHGGAVNGLGALAASEGMLHGEAWLVLLGETREPGETAGPPLVAPLRKASSPLEPEAQPTQRSGDSLPAEETRVPAIEVHDDAEHTLLGGRAHELRRNASEARTAPAAATTQPGPEPHPLHLDITAAGQDPHPAKTPGALASDDDHLSDATVPLASLRRPVEPAERVAPSAPVPPQAEAFAIDFGAAGTVRARGIAVIGRAPSAGEQRPGELAPQLISVDGAQDISRDHVRVERSGGVTIVTDLHSRNGTEIVMPGRARQRLRAGEPTAIMPGTVVDLGSGITFTVELG